MKNKVFPALAFILLAFIPSSAYGYGSYTQNQLNTTATEYNITFNATPYSEIVWVEIPRRVNITDAEWNLTGSKQNINSSTANNETVAYFCNDNWDDPDFSCYKVMDNNWGSYGTSWEITEIAEVHMNFTVLSDTAFYSWKNYDGIYNDTIDSQCLGSDILQLFVRAVADWYGGGSWTNVTCFNGSSWINVGFESGVNNGRYYEGMVYWGDPYPENITIDTVNNGENDYINTTVFNTSEILDLNETIINYYLHYVCTSDWGTGTCNIPFNVSSATAGILKISSINITGDYLDPIGNCSDDFYSASLNFSFSDELLFTSLQSDVEYTLTLLDGSGQVVNLSLDDVYYFDICSLNYSSDVDMIIQYDNTGYGLRFYFLDNASISGLSANTITLYMLNESFGSTLTGHTQNAVGFPYPEIYVQFQRYYIGENLYRTVAMMKSDNLGDGRVFVESGDVWYRYVLTKDGVVLRTIGPSLIADEFVLSTAITTITTWEDYDSGVVSSCSYSDVTKHIICTVTDPSGLSVSACLDVDTYNVINLTDYDLTCASGASITLMVNLTDAESYNNTVRYYLYLTPSNVILRDGSVSFAGAPQYGLVGILLTIIIVVTCACAGIWNPAVAIFLTVVGFVISCSMGIIQIEIAALGSLITVAAIIMYMVKT